MAGPSARRLLLGQGPGDRFTSNHRPTAQAYEERIKALAVDYGPRGVAVVAVSPNRPAAVRLDELGYSDLGDDLADMKVRPWPGMGTAE